VLGADNNTKDKTMSESKVKQCSRCKGEGFGPWRPNMGRCNLCGGAGSFRWVSLEERLERYEEARQRFMDERQAEGEARRAYLESLPRLARNSEALARRLASDELLNEQRQLWLVAANRADAPSEGGWESNWG